VENSLKRLSLPIVFSKMLAATCFISRRKIGFFPSFSRESTLSRNSTGWAELSVARFLQVLSEVQRLVRRFSSAVALVVAQAALQCSVFVSSVSKPL
jgi:hypothetical protein